MYTSLPPAVPGSTWWNAPFRDLTQNQLRRGVFRDVEELFIAVADYVMAIADYVDRHNAKPKTVYLDQESTRHPGESVVPAKPNLSPLAALHWPL